MKKIVLSENELVNIIKKVIKESELDENIFANMFKNIGNIFNKSASKSMGSFVRTASAKVPVNYTRVLEKVFNVPKIIKNPKLKGFLLDRVKSPLAFDMRIKQIDELSKLTDPNMMNTLKFNYESMNKNFNALKSGQKFDMGLVTRNIYDSLDDIKAIQQTPIIKKNTSVSNQLHQMSQDLEYAKTNLEKVLKFYEKRIK